MVFFLILPSNIFFLQTLDFLILLSSRSFWGSLLFCVCVLSHFSHVRLCDPMDCNPPGSSVHGILQARILEWVDKFKINAAET